MIVAGVVISVALLAAFSLAWWMASQSAEPIVVTVTRPKAKRKVKARLDKDDRPVLACPNCGRTGGRQGPFRSPKAVCGHMRVCKVRPQESTPGSTGA